MKTGDMVETNDGHIGEVLEIYWRKVWAYGRSRNEPQVIVQRPDGQIRVYHGGQVWPIITDEE